MKGKAVYYYNQGYNCSQCILKAAEQKYKIPINKNMVSMFSGVNNGMGVGCICSVLVAGVAIFGLLFDETSVKSMRIKLFDRFMDGHLSMCCPTLTNECKSEGGCDAIVAEAAQLIEDIIDEERQT